MFYGAKDQIQGFVHAGQTNAQSLSYITMVAFNLGSHTLHLPSSWGHKPGPSYKFWKNWWYCKS